ncbi:MAG: CoA ester lyase [Moraxella sp.]|nr:CoA ester lyase [Moraxella sp.]
MTLSLYRSFLFVPADRPDRFLKAQNSGCDAIIIDLEDTVAVTEKAAARTQILNYDKTTPKPYWVRINNDQADTFALDLACLKQTRHLAGVVAPKICDPVVIGTLKDVLGVPVLAVIESVAGFFNLQNIAKTDGLFGLSFGLLDLGNALGVSHGSHGANLIFDRIRTELVLYSSLYGLARPIETIFSDFQDEDALAIACGHAHQMGFGGQLAIHPKQIPIIHQHYRPSDAELSFAEKVLAHFIKTGEYAFAIDGKMVDLPMIDWAKRQLNQK